MKKGFIYFKSDRYEEFVIKENELVHMSEDGFIHLGNVHAAKDQIAYIKFEDEDN